MDNFSLGKLNKDSSIKSLKLSSSQIIINEDDITLSSFAFIEQIRDFPSFILNIIVRDKKIMNKLRNVNHFNISSKATSLKFNTDLCALSFSLLDEKSMQIEGLCCHPNMILKYYTRYLGNNQSQIINTMNVKKEIYSTSNIVSKFWQINSNTISTLINFCETFSNYPYWSITSNSINLSKKVKINEYKGIDDLSNITFHTKREKKINTFKYGKISVATGLDPYLFFQDQNSISNYFVNNKTFEEIQNPSIVMEGSASIDFPYRCGDRMSSGIKGYNVKFWEIHACQYAFSESSVVTKIQISGFDE